MYKVQPTPTLDLDPNRLDWESVYPYLQTPISQHTFDSTAAPWIELLPDMIIDNTQNIN